MDAAGSSARIASQTGSVAMRLDGDGVGEFPWHVRIGVQQGEVGVTREQRGEGILGFEGGHEQVDAGAV